MRHEFRLFVAIPGTAALIALMWPYDAGEFARLISTIAAFPTVVGILWIVDMTGIAGMEPKTVLVASQLVHGIHTAVLLGLGRNGTVEGDSAFPMGPFLAHALVASIALSGGVYGTSAALSVSILTAVVVRLQMSYNRWRIMEESGGLYRFNIPDWVKFIAADVSWRHYEFVSVFEFSSGNGFVVFRVYPFHGGEICGWDIVELDCVPSSGAFTAHGSNTSVECIVSDHCAIVTEDGFGGKVVVAARNGINPCVVAQAIRRHGRPRTVQTVNDPKLAQSLALLGLETGISDPRRCRLGTLAAAMLDRASGRNVVRVGTYAGSVIAYSTAAFALTAILVMGAILDPLSGTLLMAAAAARTTMPLAALCSRNRSIGIN